MTSQRPIDEVCSSDTSTGCVGSRHERNSHATARCQPPTASSTARASPQPVLGTRRPVALTASATVPRASRLADSSPSPSRSRARPTPRKDSEPLRDVYAYTWERVRSVARGKCDGQAVCLGALGHDGTSMSENESRSHLSRGGTARDSAPRPFGSARMLATRA
ncbi:hypothetical protein EXIGLDRAFT_401527 [Exidia glandulosa HHB12029]|uniref:Uncharacterized protein n=1 Tax=Exidia glandulosa HHB12029 TaxID=1314781 RepID=A0A165BL10_EXIGL|nr:hypothetical protein EXIGLDRAFT_401527 [Exidia glandulosa HHB12029]